MSIIEITLLGKSQVLHQSDEVVPLSGIILHYLPLNGGEPFCSPAASQGQSSIG